MNILQNFTECKQIKRIYKTDSIKHLGFLILTNIPEIIKNTTQKIKRNINITGNRIYYQSITVKKILFTALIESLIIFHLNSLFSA